jgi:hypothetical protein
MLDPTPRLKSIQEGFLSPPAFKGVVPDDPRIRGMSLARMLSSLMQLSLFDEAPASATPVAPAPMPPPRTGPELPSATRPSVAANPGEFRHPRSQRDIVLGEHRVAYELRRSRRRSIGFVIGAEGLAVSAPKWVGVGEIESALREKTAWILRKLHEQRERARRLDSAKVDWREGTAIPFLGEQVILVLDNRTTGATPDAAPGFAAVCDLNADS